MAASYYSYFGTPGAGGFRQSLPCETLVAAAGAAPGIPRAVGQASKTHMVLGILATQKQFRFPSPTLVPNVCDATLVLLPEVGTLR